MEGASTLHRTANKAWPDVAFTPPPAPSEAIYQQVVGPLFHAPALTSAQPVNDKEPDGARVHGADLFVYRPPTQPWWQRWLWGSPAQQLVDRIATSLLVVQQPRWPLEHILLIVRADQTDWNAVAWIERLAQPERTVVSVLPVVPAIPRLHRISEAAQPTPDVLLAPNTVSGAMLGQLLNRLQHCRLPATLLLGSGEPDTRIRAEVTAGDPDLIVIAAESQSRWVRWFQGELVRPLLHWVDRPLLIAKA